MDQIIIKFISGSKINQQEIFSLPLDKDILIGRDPSAEIIFDAHKDDLVSRQHARISQEPNKRQVSSCQI